MGCAPLVGDPTLRRVFSSLPSLLKSKKEPFSVNRATSTLLFYSFWKTQRPPLNGLPRYLAPFFLPLLLLLRLSKNKKKKGKEKPKEVEKEKREVEVPKKQLSSLRVMQKTLVYVIGIPLKIATEEVRSFFFSFSFLSFSCFLLFKLLHFFCSS